MTWLELAVAMAMAMTLLAGVWLGATLLRSASAAEVEAARARAASAEESALNMMEAAKAVSSMTQTLADSSIREAQLGERMELLRTQVVNLTDVVSMLQSQLSRNTDNLTLMMDSFIQRGYLREAKMPPQVGERERPAPMPPSLVPNAREENSRSHTEPIATG